MLANFKTKVFTGLIFSGMLLGTAVFSGCNNKNTKKETAFSQAMKNLKTETQKDSLMSLTIKENIRETLELMKKDSATLNRNSFLKANVLVLYRNYDFAYEVYRDFGLAERTGVKLDKTNFTRMMTETSEKQMKERLDIIFSNGLFNTSGLDFSKDVAIMSLIPISFDIIEIVEMAYREYEKVDSAEKKRQEEIKKQESIIIQNQQEYYYE